MLRSKFITFISYFANRFVRVFKDRSSDVPSSPQSRAGWNTSLTGQNRSALGDIQNRPQPSTTLILCGLHQFQPWTDGGYTLGMEYKTRVDINTKNVIAAWRSLFHDLDHKSYPTAKVNYSRSKQLFNVNASHACNIDEIESVFNPSMVLWLS